MARREWIVDRLLYDENRPIADIEEIRRFNAQRFEMEQLTGILYENFADKTAVGYLDTSDQSFWVRGHMPEFPLMPGVIMCESAAQLTSFFVNKYDLMQGCIIGLGGLESVRFRGIVRPGDRFVVQVKLVHSKKILITAEFIGLVGRSLVCEGVVKGIPIANKEPKEKQ
ncbi:MAG: beta-hydroxyacyl-ACP dehydratase [Planctomycetaceae bacterium]|jgi:3-hydroxyacyl-[acyl-carrier-protein] dehydratase|nr:beta-hydroxyacyl-ACP dehydratase [Planctomycetaceae bacterium]